MYNNVVEVSIENEVLSKDVKTKDIAGERIYYLDILRILAIMGVITLHVASTPVIKMDFIGSTQWWVANVIDGSMRWAIPVFFMLSGALLLGSKKEESIGSFYKRSFKRLGIPFIMWSIIYFFFKHCYLGKESLEPMVMFTKFLNEFFTDNIYNHLWFMYVILTLYFIAPFFKAMVQNLRKRDLQIIIISWIIIGFIYPFIQNLYFENFGVTYNIKFFGIPFFTGYAGYFVLGYYLRIYEVKNKTRIFSYIAGFISAVMVPLLTYAFSIDKLVLDERFYGHFSITSVLMGIAVFLYIQDINWNEILNVKMRRLVSSLSGSTFGIYFVHMAVQTLLLENLTSQILTDSLTIIPVYIFILSANYFISYIIVKVIGLNAKLNAILVG